MLYINFLMLTSILGSFRIALMETFVANALNSRNCEASACYPGAMITPEQIRAARQLLSWSQGDLAKAANLPLWLIKNIERGATDPRQTVVSAIERAFDAANVIFLEVDDVRPGGRGVRFKR
jgi:DNA-binding XRE family transcriptional regulator